MGTHTKCLGATVAVFAILMLVAGLGLVGCGGGSKPINEQSCGEMVKTLRDIEHRLASHDFNTVRSADEDAAKLNNRVNSLGGCPSEPSLRKQL
jgi:hypothetical protein